MMGNLENQIKRLPFHTGKTFPDYLLNVSSFTAQNTAAPFLQFPLALPEPNIIYMYHTTPAKREEKRICMISHKSPVKTWATEEQQRLLLRIHINFQDIEVMLFL